VEKQKVLNIVFGIMKDTADNGSWDGGRIVTDTKFCRSAKE